MKNPLLAEIEAMAKDMGEVRIMEVCGGHTNTVMRFGLRDVLPSNVRLISGPGCPVCVTSQHDIDSMVELALSGVPVATYGDMINVPGTKMSLVDAQNLGADVRMVYSIDQIINEKERVFFAVGFDTTTPMTAKLLSAGIRVFTAHKVMPPAMRVLTQEIIGKIFLDYIAAVSKTYDEVRDAVGGIDLHDMPQDGTAADQDHGLRNLTGFFRDPCPKTACENDALHPDKFPAPDCAQPLNAGPQSLIAMSAYRISGAIA